MLFVSYCSLFHRVFCSTFIINTASKAVNCFIFPLAFLCQVYHVRFHYLWMSPSPAFLPRRVFPFVVKLIIALAVSLSLDVSLRLLSRPAGAFLSLSNLLSHLPFHYLWMSPSAAFLPRRGFPFVVKLIIVLAISLSLDDFFRQFPPFMV